MLSFKAALINEIERMCRKKKVVVFTALDIAICLLNVVGRNLLKMNNITIVSENTATNILSLFCLYIIPIYVIMETMEVFSAQYGDKTISNILVRPISRLKIYLSKIVAVAIFIVFHLLIVLGVMLILGFSSNVSVGQLILSVVVSIYPMLAMGCAMGLLSQVVKNGLFGMLLSVILLLGAKAAQIFFIQPSAFLFTSYFDWYKIFITSNLRPAHMLNTFLLLSATTVFTFALGYSLFERKEF